jgi:pimeloyl-ACP methyl ester carboxylesterase
MAGIPETRYAKSGDAHIAYQVTGAGPSDLVYSTSFLSNVEVLWENPAAARFLDALASFSRLILFDRRGVGMSDAWGAAATVEHRVDDLEAVLDAAGSARAVLLGSSEGAATSAVFAAAHPERVSALVLFSPFGVALHDEECPWAWPPEFFDAFDQSVDQAWGTGAGIELVNPSLAGNEEAQR